MWNKRDEVPSSTPTNRNVQAEPPRQAAAPHPQQGVRDVAKEPASSSAAAIGSSMIIKGDIFSREELYVDGEVEGKLELQHRLTIGPRGKVKAQIRAREVVIAGNVSCRHTALLLLTLPPGIMAQSAPVQYWTWKSVIP